MLHDEPIQKIRGQYIKDYRQYLKFTQEQLAELIGVDARSIGAWERGRVNSIRNTNLVELVHALGMPPGLLGLPEYLTPEGAEKMEREARAFLEEGAYLSAQALCASLTPYLTKLVRNGKAAHLPALIRIKHLTGITIATLKNKPDLALHKYMQMAQDTYQLENVDPIALALAHIGQADMYRRLGKFDVAQDLLESVESRFRFAKRSGTEIDIAVLGNCYQLLTRVYLARGEISQSLEALRKAMDLADQMSVLESPWYICFGKCSTMEEAAKTYMLLRQYDKSFEYIAQAKILSRNAAPRWEIPITLTEGESYARASRDVEPPHAKAARNEPEYYERGFKSLLEGYELAKDHNHLRQMQRVQRLTTKWEHEGGISLELAHTLREEMAKIDRTKGNA